MSEKGLELELTDEQRENVRKMLEKFGAKKDKQSKQAKSQQLDQHKVDPDPLESSPPGSTIEWHELTPKTRRYAFVKETRAHFVPYILDKLPMTETELGDKISSIGMDITSQNASLTVCSIVQADPIRIFQIQTKKDGQNYYIDTIRYIV
jgi:hypothetical protein